MRLRIASGSAWKSVNVQLFRFVLMTTLFTFTCLQYLSMLGCCLHFILFSVENFLEKHDSFLVESVLLLCNLFYTSFLILCHKWPPFCFRWLLHTSLCIEDFTITCTSATFILEHHNISIFLVCCVECSLKLFCFWFWDRYLDRDRPENMICCYCTLNIVPFPVNYSISFILRHCLIWAAT